MSKKKQEFINTLKESRRVRHKELKRLEKILLDALHEDDFTDTYDYAIALHHIYREMEDNEQNT